MALVVSHQSALEFWRRAPESVVAAALAELRQCGTPQLRVCDLQGGSKPSPVEAQEVADLFPCVFTGSLHVLVGTSAARVRRACIVPHVGAASYPPGSFVRIASGAWVASPELCFVQLSQKLSLARAVELGTELCGRYRKDSRQEKGMATAWPLATPESLACYGERAKGVYGRKVALKACRYTVPSSRSPMETAAYMLFALPRTYGGRNTTVPQLNERIDIPAEVRPVTNSRYFEADLLWPQQRLIVEYDSKQEHVGSERIARDAVRKNVLTSMGYTVLTLTTRQLFDYGEFCRFARMLESHLGTAPSRGAKDFAPEQRALWETLAARSSLSAQRERAVRQGQSGVWPPSV